MIGDLRLEVGYGLEGVLPDAIANQIISQYIIPRFRAGDFSSGIVAGIDAVLKVIKREPLPEAARQKPANPSGSGSVRSLAWCCCLAAYSRHVDGL